MKILTYNDMEFDVSIIPADISDLCEISTGKAVTEPGIILRLLAMGHTSPLEFIQLRIDIRNVSRSFLAQLTRHRMGSFMSGSQHYQDYRDYSCVVHPKYVKLIVDPAYSHFDNKNKEYCALEIAFMDYEFLINEGVPPEEARQVLPNAAAVNIAWSVNLRSLVNFFEQRCCNRNTDEMQLFANRLRKRIVGHLPNLDGYLGPECHTTGKCRQGKMRCEQKHWSNHDTIDI